MSNPTLSEIVSSALEQVGAETPTVKLASSSDVPPTEPAPLTVVPEPVGASEEKVASTAEILEDSAYGLKLAASLEVAATIVQQKLAEGEVVPPAPGNAVATLEATDNVPVTLTPAPKGVVEKAVTSEAKIEAGPMPDSQPDHTGNPDWTNNKEAAEAHIQAKIAQAELLEELGQHEAAADLLGEAEKLSVSNKWIADKLVSGARKKGDTISKLPFMRANQRSGLALAQAAGGKKARNAQAVLQAQASRIRGKHGYVNTLRNAKEHSNSPKMVAESTKLVKAVQNRIGAVADALKKTATAESSPLVVEGEITSNMLPDNAGAYGAHKAHGPNTKKTASQRGATIGGAVPGVLALGAPIGASEGKRLKTWGGALGGQVAGALGGSLAGSRFGPKVSIPLSFVGAMTGGALGARAAHGPDSKKKAKTASAESSPLVIEGEITSNMLPDNAGAIAMTTAQAKSKSQAEASALLNQTPQKDPVVEAELEHTEVAKVSSLLQAVSIRGLG